MQVEFFEKHTRKRIVFSPLATSFIGLSDEGKSSLMRALRWACLNEPSGTAFIQWGQQFTRVRLGVDGRTVTRRAGDKNIYKLDAEVYKAFGRNVPDDIAQLLNVSELNFQRQIEGPFWLTQSAPEVSRALNAIIDLGVIDETLATSASAVRKERATLDVCKARQYQAKERRDALAVVPALRDDWAQCKALLADAAAVKKARQELDTLVQYARNTQGNAERASRIAAAANAVFSAASGASKAAKRRLELAGLVSGLRRAKAAADAKPVNVGPVLKAVEAWRLANLDKSLLELLVKEGWAWLAKAKAAGEAAEAYNAQAKSALGEQCPLCSQPIRIKM